MKSECSPKAPRRLAAVGERGKKREAERERERERGSDRFIHKTPTVPTRRPTRSRPRRRAGPRQIPFYPLAPTLGPRRVPLRRTTGSRIPLVSAAGTTNRQRDEKLSRPSSTSFLIHLFLANRRPNKGIREAADDVGISAAPRAYSNTVLSSSLSLSLFAVYLIPRALPEEASLSLSRL